MTSFRDKNSFNTSFLTFKDNVENNQKTISIPIKNKNNREMCKISKSWDVSYKSKEPGKTSYSPYGDETRLAFRYSNHSPEITSNNLTPGAQGSPWSKSRSRERSQYNPFHNNQNELKPSEFKPYDAINNCKSAGVIPYTIHNGTIYFLFQQLVNPVRKKDNGWNDFGGKKIDANESTADAAGREFSEETSCLFYLKENASNINLDYYNLLKDNEELLYDDNTIDILKSLIPCSQKFYSEKITEFVLPIYISSKETYISYFIKVPYISEEDLPRAEDLHIPYEYRYIRECKWFTLDELMELDEKDFHKRLQITRIQQRIYKYHNKNLFNQ